MCRKMTVATQHTQIVKWAPVSQIMKWRNLSSYLAHQSISRYLLLTKFTTTLAQNMNNVYLMNPRHSLTHSMSSGRLRDKEHVSTFLYGPSGGGHVTTTATTVAAKLVDDRWESVINCISRPSETQEINRAGHTFRWLVGRV